MPWKAGVGWLYRAGLESIFGFHLRGDRLQIDPCILVGWANYQIKFKYRSSNYQINVENPQSVARSVT